MRASLLPVCLLALSACSSTPAPRALAMKDIAFKLRDFRYPSGLRVVVEDDKRTPNVAVVALVGSGSTDDPPGKEGLAHYLEHLAFRTHPGGGASVRRRLNLAGVGEYNASTSLDETTYHEVGPKESLGALLAIEAERLLSPAEGIPEDAGKVELEVVRNELRERNETGFAGNIFATMQEVLFPASDPYARPIAGSHTSLDTLTQDDARAFASAHYKPENMTMVVVGDVDLATVDKVLDASLPGPLKAGPPGGIKPAQRLAPVAAEPPASPPQSALVRREATVDTPELWLGWTLPRGFGAEGQLDRFAGAAAGAVVVDGYFADSDIVGVQLLPLLQNRASMMLCRITLRAGAHPEKSAEHVLDQLYQAWLPSSTGAAVVEDEHAFVELLRGSVTSMVLDAESLAARGIERASYTHMTQDPAAYSKSFRTMLQLSAPEVRTFASKYLTRARARKVLFTPPTERGPVARGGGATAARGDDELTDVTIGDELIRLVARPLGAASFPKRTLANGLEVIVAPRPGLPVVALELLQRGGASTAPSLAYEDAAFLARPHLKDHTRPSDVGAFYRVSHGTDSNAHLIRAASGNVGTVMAFLGQAIPSLYAEPLALREFHDELVPFLAREELAPRRAAQAAFRKALFGEHLYGRSIWAKDAEALSADTLNEWIQATNAPETSTLIVVGDVDPNQVFAMAEERLGGWSPRKGEVPPPSPPKLPESDQPVRFAITPQPGATQAVLELGCLLPEIRGRAKRMLLGSLVQNRAGVLRSTLGLTYGVHASVESLRGGTTDLRVATSVANAGLSKTFQVLHGVMAKLSHVPMTPSALSVARFSVARGLGVSYGTNASLAGAIGNARLLSDGVESLDKAADDLLGMTPESVQAIFAKCSAGLVLQARGDEALIRAGFDEGWK